VIVFGDGAQDERFRSVELGFDAYLSRDMSDMEITATISAKLSRYRNFIFLRLLMISQNFSTDANFFRVLES